MTHNISIATPDDIIHISDDVNVNIYPVHLSWATIVSINFLNWLDFRPYFCEFLVSGFGN